MSEEDKRIEKTTEWTPLEGTQVASPTIGGASRKGVKMPREATGMMLRGSLRMSEAGRVLDYALVITEKEQEETRKEKLIERLAETEGGKKIEEIKKSWCGEKRAVFEMLFNKCTYRKEIGRYGCTILDLNEITEAIGINHTRLKEFLFQIGSTTLENLRNIEGKEALCIDTILSIKPFYDPKYRDRGLFVKTTGHVSTLEGAPIQGVEIEVSPRLIESLEGKNGGYSFMHADTFLKLKGLPIVTSNLMIILTNGRVDKIGEDLLIEKLSLTGRVKKRGRGNVIREITQACQELVKLGDLEIYNYDKTRRMFEFKRAKALVQKERTKDNSEKKDKEKRRVVRG